LHVTNTYRNSHGYGYSNGNRIAAGYTDATASSHAAAKAVVLTDRMELARKPREFPSDCRASVPAPNVFGVHRMKPSGQLSDIDGRA
jgi:hypothetical protein